jgi:hypothetical protein
LRREHGTSDELPDPSRRLPIVCRTQTGTGCLIRQLLESTDDGETLDEPVIDDGLAARHPLRPKKKAEEGEHQHELMLQLDRGGWLRETPEGSRGTTRVNRVGLHLDLPWALKGIPH